MLCSMVLIATSCLFTSIFYFSFHLNNSIEWIPGKEYSHYRNRTKSQTPRNNSDSGKSSDSNLKRKVVIVKDAYAEPALVSQNLTVYNIPKNDDVFDD